jgi:FAD/FMN-containing dehydrogenase
MENQLDNTGPVIPPDMPPDREVVAQIALDLARVNANPDSEANFDAVRADIQAHGVAAYFHAAAQTLEAERVRAEQEAQAMAALGLGTAGLFPLPGSQGRSRQTWLNCIGNPNAQPLRVYRPQTLDDLRVILLQAESRNCRVKATGSGHSFTDVAVTRDFLIETHGLGRTLPLEREVLRPNARPRTLFATEAGIIVRDLNEALWRAGLGLENMGGYDGQTIAGVVSTSTHGSGLAFGPLASQVVSLTIVAAGGRIIRVEPAGGITNPAAWAARHPEIELKQDDDWFNACLVNLGCLGVIYSVILRVRPRFFLKEERTLSTWSQVRQDLQQGSVFQENAHYEVLVNPYATHPNGDHTCLITRRNPVPAPVEPPASLPRRNFFIELVASIPGQNLALLAALNAFPAFTPNIIDEAMKAIAGVYIDRSYRVFNIGAANDVPAYGSEIGFSMRNYLEAVDCILEIAGQRQAVGQAYLNSPFSMRFVKASPAHLSMMEGADTCMVEFISLDHTIGGRELLQELETQMYAFGGRPHWGLLNFISGAGGLVEAMYPRLPRWQAVRAELDPNGRFANAFSERCGLTPRRFVRA